MRGLMIVAVMENGVALKRNGFVSVSRWFVASLCTRGTVHAQAICRPWEVKLWRDDGWIRKRLFTWFCVFNVINMRTDRKSVV